MAEHQAFEAGASPRDELVILLHGFSGASERLSSVRRAVRAAKPSADVFNPLLPFGRRLCMVKAEVLIAELMDEIEQVVADRIEAGGTYDRIVVVGHSMGAVLARKIVVAACGEQRNDQGDVPAPFEPELHRFREPRAWAPLLKRLVLMAGVNRGWTVSSSMTWLDSVWWAIRQLAGELVLRGRPTIFAIRRGAPFLVQTRLQWLALMNPVFGRRPDLVAVQLLGTRDDHVAPDDNVDYSVDQFESGGEPSYFYIEVGKSGHSDVVEMDEQGPDPATQAERRAKFLIALDAGREQLAKQGVPREQMGDSLPAKPDQKIGDVVFVVHGIRDRGFWAEKIARTIKRHAGARPFVSWTQSYGYFAILPFLFRSIRQRKVEWLMDCYTEARARHPDARFHYVGHSNGSYLVAQALHDYPAATFENIVLAGSVVRRDYDWLSWTTPARGKPRVGKLLNYVASNDCVVAMFPKGLQRWGARIGSAGHDGFDQGSRTGPIRNMEYIIGSHGAGHQEDHWNDIAGFIVNGRWPEPKYPPYAGRRTWRARILGWISFLAFPLLILLVLAFGGLLLWSVFLQWPQPVCHVFARLAGLMPDWKFLWAPCTAEISAATTAWRGFFFILYCWVVGLFVLRF